MFVSANAGFDSSSSSVFVFYFSGVALSRTPRPPTDGGGAWDKRPTVRKETIPSEPQHDFRKESDC